MVRFQIAQMSPQQYIAHYQIVSKLGEGGMGEVYRATDTRLNRAVAIKILAPAFAQDAARMARFEREAQVLASLNHPNIAAIYGVEQGAIVMELVEGEDLRGPVPPGTALEYARQIAAGLEAAHERGIIHRDLKPANIKIAPDGIVKILDFGLAKAGAETAAPAPSASPTLSPTISLEMTQAGMILGTAAYMAPEQARGKPVDKRADIWAFGVVVFELLTGATLFGGGETVSDSLAAVITKNPDWSALPNDTPPHLRRLLERCLCKDPKLRLRDIGEARILLDQPLAAAPVAATLDSARQSRLPWAITALVSTVLVGVSAVAWFRPKAADPLTVRFVLPWPDGTTEPGGPTEQLTASPDGRTLAMIAIGSDGNSALWIRPIGSPSAHRLDKTDGATEPFWSSDGQFIAFFADDKLKKIPAGGGSPQTLCEAPSSAGPKMSGEGGTWNPAGDIVLSPGAGSPLMRVSAAGGLPTPVTKLDIPGGENRHAWPQFLPDGRHLLYFAGNQDQSKNAIYVQELGSEARIKVVLSTGHAAWSQPGYLLFLRGLTLFAQRMDPRNFQLSGDAVPVAEGIFVHSPSGRAPFEFSGGVLAYRAVPDVVMGQLAWYGRDGKRLSAVGKPAAYTSLRLSPDDKSAIVSIAPVTRGDVWIVDLATGGLRHITSGGTFVLGPWAHDAQRLAVNLSSSQGVLEVAPTSAGSRRLGPAPLYANDWSPDGRFLLCTDINGEHWTLLRADGSQQMEAISPALSHAFDFRFAPDGKHVAFTTTDTGVPEVVVSSFPSFAERHQVSIDGGSSPAWVKDGREIVFQQPDGTVMSVEIRAAGGKIEASVPKPLLKRRPRSGRGLSSYFFWPTSDGERFLAIESNQANAAQTVLVLNWSAELKPEPH
jgi:serine/threonine protein kinase/dipeptidyl aminopeptidase/acylaminoacyl peptidase